MPLTEPEMLKALMKWRTRISAAAWVVVHDVHAAEDIFQNVVIKALTTDVTFENASALVSWSFITARREAIDWLKRYRREVTSVNGSLSSEILQALKRDWQSPQQVPVESRTSAMEECLKSTPEESRRLLRLRYFEGLQCEDVAAKMGVALAAVYKRLSRLHESLRQCIEGRLATSASREFRPNANQ